MIIQPAHPDELMAVLSERTLILYGMGDMGKRIAKWCDEHRVHYLCSDRDKEKLSGCRRVSIQEIVSKFPEANIVVTSLVYGREITDDLLRLGVKKERILPATLFMPEKVTWKDLEENGRADWDLMYKRMQMLAEWRWIPNGVKSVADYGAGHMAVKGLLPKTAVYYPIDCTDRGEGTIICDFNKREFPDIFSEMSLCIGVLMYIEPAEELIDHICRHTEQRIIAAYTTLEGFPDIEARQRSGQCNDFTEGQVLGLFAVRGWRAMDMKHNTTGNTQRTFFLFERMLEELRI